MNQKRPLAAGETLSIWKLTHNRFISIELSHRQANMLLGGKFRCTGTQLKAGFAEGCSVAQHWKCWIKPKLNRWPLCLQSWMAFDGGALP